MNKREQRFVEIVRAYYTAHGRHDLPWRKTKNPYRILVSEVMLQQTQVERVKEKYVQFLKQFPTVSVLAHASLGEVLRAWQGLGYNRRAKMLHLAAQELVSGFPQTHKELVALPGVGAYTAGAILAFAYNIPVPIIETNIRTVYLQHFFKGENAVSDAEIMQIVERTLDLGNPREWYSALMDYGAYLKKQHGNHNVRSKQYVKQSVFKGSKREIRGTILKTLARNESIRTLPFEKEKIEVQLLALEREGMVERKGRGWRLP